MSEATDPRYEETFYLVEATDYEALMCWKEWHERLEWKSESDGWLATCGELPGLGPVCATVTWAVIGGKRVLFYEACSRYVDHTMVLRYLQTRCPKAKKTSALNFHLCAHDIEREGGAKVSACACTPGRRLILGHAPGCPVGGLDPQ